MTNPILRPLIAKDWRQLDVKHSDYGQFLHYYDNPNFLTHMQKLIETRLSRNGEGRKIVFDEIMRLTEGDGRAQTGYLLRNYQHVPGLRLEVLKRFDLMLSKGNMSASDRHRAEEFFAGQDPAIMPPLIKQQVEGVLERIASEKKVEVALSALNRPGQGRVESMRELASMKDVRAIRPLLEHAVAGHPETQAEALRALQKFSPALVKFYAQTYRRENLNNPVLARRLEQLISSHAYVAPASGLAAGLSQGN
jgi:hypothetical protein